VYVVLVDCEPEGAQKISSRSRRSLEMKFISLVGRLKDERMDRRVGI